MRLTPDHVVRELRRHYDAHQQAKAAGLTPPLTIVDIAKLYGLHWTTVIRIGQRLQRYDVPDAQASIKEGRTPRQPSNRTLRRRAGKP